MGSSYVAHLAVFGGAFLSLFVFVRGGLGLSLC